MASMTGKVARQSGMNRFDLKRSHHTKKSAEWQSKQRERKIAHLTRGQMKDGKGRELTETR